MIESSKMCSTSNNLCPFEVQICVTAYSLITTLLQLTKSPCATINPTVKNFYLEMCIREFKKGTEGTVDEEYTHKISFTSHSLCSSTIYGIVSCSTTLLSLGSLLVYKLLYICVTVSIRVSAVLEYFKSASHLPRAGHYFHIFTVLVLATIVIK